MSPDNHLRKEVVMETLAMSGKERRRLEVLSRVQAGEVSLVKGGRVAGAELPPGEAGVGSLSGVGGRGTGAWPAWSGFESACSTAPQGAGVGTLSGEVHRVWAHAGGRMDGARGGP